MNKYKKKRKIKEKRRKKGTQSTKAKKIIQRHESFDPQKTSNYE